VDGSKKDAPGESLQGPRSCHHLLKDVCGKFTEKEKKGVEKRGKVGRGVKKKNKGKKGTRGQKKSIKLGGEKGPEGETKRKKLRKG